jgi:hypothetical protein
LKVQSQLVIPFNELMIEYKELWTIELEKYSSNQVANARKSLGYIYTYLYRHDRNWLLTINKIKSRKVIAAQLKLDWPQLDNHYAEQISHVVNKLKVENLKGRITKNIIVSALNGHSHILSKHKNKLPNSFARLDLFIESKTEYAIRRVNFAVKQLKLDFDHPAKWRILRSAGISKHSSEDVIRYVDSIIQKIAS